MDDLIARLRDRVRAHPEQKTPIGNVTIRARPPATAEQLRSSEERLGFRLPLVLRRVYLEVANGGFGPGYGFMGAEGGFADDLGQRIVDARDAFLVGESDDATWFWPRHHVPICHWGCVVYSIVDCVAEGSPVLWADIGGKEPGEPMSTIIRPHKPTLEEWLRDWLDGRDLWTDSTPD